VGCARQSSVVERRQTTNDGSGSRATGPTSSGSNDAVARLVRLLGIDDYLITTTVYGAPSGGAEVEHFGRMLYPTSTTCTGYELDFTPSLSNVVTIAKWMGTQGVVDTSLGSYVMAAALVAGDIIESRFKGARIQCWHTPIGTGVRNLIFDVTDVNAGGVGPYLTGPPAMGFDAGTVPDGNAFGWNSFRVDAA
jgi:hypothetical protein